MTRNKRTQQLLRDVLVLPPRARADIAATLLHSLEQPEDANAEEAWAAEIKRRIDAVDSGHVKLIPWRTVKRRFERRIRRAHKKP